MAADTAPLDIDTLRQWIGRTASDDDIAALAPLRALTATLDRDDPPVQPGQQIPPLWHWLYFLPMHRQSEIGADGHPQRGGFLPPVPLPRRMWAGSRVAFQAPIVAGQALRRDSRIADVRLKAGRNGALVFVNVVHEVFADEQLALVDEHDIVYRGLPQPGEVAPAGTPAPTDDTWSRRIVPDDVLLFRYSALTFNGHRIHYDRRYVTEVEGYPGLVVHGPLIATLLLDLLRRERPEARVTQFTFRAMHPVFDIAPFEVCGRPQSTESGEQQVRLWARTTDGLLAMDATATLA